MKKILLSVFVLGFLLPILSFASFDTSLKYGSRGDAVIELQDLLVAQGFLNGKVDGRYGLVTLNAVKAFQTANGLSPDGYFGKASRAKANDILATTLQSSNTAEQTDIGTITTVSTVAGCTPTSLYSPTTGQPCNITTQPTISNLPAGCTSTSGFSSITGQACNGINSTIQQLQQTVQQQTQTIQQIQQNTQQLVQNTAPVDVCLNINGIQTYVPSGYSQDSNNNCITHTILRDLQIEDNLEEGSKIHKIRVTVIDNNGNKIENASLMAKYPYTQETTHDNGNSPSTFNTVTNTIYFGGSYDRSVIDFKPQYDKTPVEITFYYEPLNLRKTITVINN